MVLLLSGLVILVLVLFSMIPSGHSIHTVQGQETGVIPIYECQEIYRSGVYVLARDISGVYPKKDYCIGIFADDVVLDGNGHSMTSQYYGDGIYVEASDNVTIKNLRISKYGTGIYIYDTFLIGIHGILQ